jgi:hypothetical protein
MAGLSGTRSVVVVCLVLIGIFVAAGWYQALDRDLSEPPQRAAAGLVPKVPASLLSLNVTVPFERLAAAADAATPPSYQGAGNGPDVCVRVGVKVCAGTRYDFTATRGPLSFSEGPDNSIRISVPLEVTGEGGFRGDGARLVHMDAKRFKASVDAYADVALDLQPDWCPRVKVNADFSNLDARVEIVSKTWIKVSDLIEGSVRQQIQKIGEHAASALKCDDVRKVVEAAWVNQSFPLSLPGDPRSLHVNVEPVSVGFSGVSVTPSAAQFMVSVGARVAISDTAIGQESRPMPVWESVPLRHGALRAAIPLRMSYEGLTAHLQSSLAGKTFSLPTPAGAGTLAMDDITVYPAGDRIAVGAHINAKLPDRFLTTRGWVYLTARPEVSADGQFVRLADISYSRIMDSTLVNMLTVLLDGQIREGLASAGKLDFTSSIEKAKEVLKAGLAKHSAQLSVDMGEPSLRLGRIVPGAGALFVEGLFSSGADVALVGAR